MTTITISRQFGSGGSKIANQVCEILGYRYFDKRLIAQVATEVGLSEHGVVDYSEQHYREKPFIDRFMQTVFGARTASVPAPRQSWGGLEAHLDEDWSVELANRAIRSAYEEGNVVIVGRGAQVVLRDKPNVLHVRIQAPMETRVRRLQQTEGVSVEQATRIASEHDRASSRYLDRFFKTRWDDPMLYHLIINTGVWTPELAAAVIADAVQKMQTVTVA
jgi:CMP/dCMP kinase